MSANKNNPLVVEARHEVFSGPLPSPEDLQRYKNIDDGFAERIFRMAEDHNAANVAIKKSRAISPILGQVFSFLMSMAGFGTAIFFGFRGTEAGAIAAIIGGISPIIVAALSNLKKK
jgi:uncharacterized membrane protein